MSIIYTQGTFDLFHVGHLNLLKRCSVLGTVIVSLLTDEAIEKYRGKPPIITYEDREDLLMACKYVDAVIPLDDVAKTQNQIRASRPEFVVLGSDWAKKDIYKQYQMSREELDPLLIFFPYTQGISSTLIKEKVKAQ